MGERAVSLAFTHPISEVISQSDRISVLWLVIEVLISPAGIE